MGCCESSEADSIKQTDIPAPRNGEAIHVYLEKQGTFKSDYDVYDISDNRERENWMLVDTVGGGFKTLKYFLKHHEEGKDEMKVLCAAEIKATDSDFSYKVKEDETELEIDLDFDSDDDIFSDDESVELEIEEERKIKSKWKLCKECKFYADRELTEPIGELKVKAKGKYKRKIKDTLRIIEDENIHGDEMHREEKTQEITHDTKLKKFYYKLKLHGEKIEVEVEKSNDNLSFRQADLVWTGRSEDGAELFKVTSDGRNCTIKTSDGTDPNGILLAAFACACEYHPALTQEYVERKCEQIEFDDGMGGVIS